MKKKFEYFCFKSMKLSDKIGLPMDWICCELETDMIYGWIKMDRDEKEYLFNPASKKIALNREQLLEIVYFVGLLEIVYFVGQFEVKDEM
jgi:hypothetical protein